MTDDSTKPNPMKQAIESMLFDVTMSLVREVKKSGKMNLDIMEYLKRCVEIQGMLNKIKDELPSDTEFQGLDIGELVRKAKGKD